MQMHVQTYLETRSLEGVARRRTLQSSQNHTSNRSNNGIEYIAVPIQTRKQDTRNDGTPKYWSHPRDKK